MFKPTMWFHQGEADDNATGDLAGGAGDDAGAGAAGGDGAAADGGGEGKAAAPLTDAQLTTGMDEAIAAALKPEEEKVAAKPAGEAKLGGESKPAEKAAAKPDGKLAEKTLEELALTDLERKHWKQETQQRYDGLLTQLKATTAERDAIRAEREQLAGAREAILGVMKDTHTSDDDLAQLLEFNRLVKTGSLEGALKLVEGQRTAILKAMGKEAPGVDLLADHPDLQADVDDLKITRERALELVRARQERSRMEAAAKATSATRQSQEQQQQASESALASIEKWTASLAKSDIDYKAKEAKLLAKVAGVVKQYPPAQWLPTLQLLYEGIEVTKAAPAGRVTQPLRASGAKPGSPAPTDMKQAIDQGLGYGQT